MTTRTSPPFSRRPRWQPASTPELLSARADFAAKRIDDDALRAAEDCAIRDAVTLQEGLGLHSATDREFRRSSWHMDFIYQLGGITSSDEQLQVPRTCGADRLS